MPVKQHCLGGKHFSSLAYELCSEALHVCKLNSSFTKTFTLSKEWVASEVGCRTICSAAWMKIKLNQQHFSYFFSAMTRCQVSIIQMPRCLEGTGVAFSEPVSTYSVEYDDEVDIAAQELRKDRQLVLPDISLLTSQYWKTITCSICCTALSISWQGLTKASQYLICRVSRLVCCAVKGSVYQIDCHVSLGENY